MKRINITIDLEEIPAHIYQVLVTPLRSALGDCRITIGFDTLFCTDAPPACPDCKGSGYKDGHGGTYHMMGEPPPICPTCTGSGRNQV